MSAQPVGVLAVMDRTLNDCADIAEFREARAAVSELIEAAKGIDIPALFPNAPGPERLRLRAALARCEGVAS